MIHSFLVKTQRQGLHEITAQVNSFVAKAKIHNGLCTIFLRHTSASLIIQENADPSAKADIESWINRLIPENDPEFTHTAEGPDDMPSHLKAAITNVSLGIPVIGGQLALGTWQGIYLWEHRKSTHQRQIVIHLSPDPD